MELLHVMCVCVFFFFFFFNVALVTYIGLRLCGFFFFLNKYLFLTLDGNVTISNCIIS